MKILNESEASQAGAGPRTDLPREPEVRGLQAGYTGRAVFVGHRGGPEVLEVRERHIPAPGPGDVVIAVRAAGVAFGDLLLREGLNPEARLPSIPGYDAAGVVLAVGTGVNDLAVGAHVAVWTGGTGGYATHITVPAWAAVEYPPELNPELVASLILNYLTAYQMLTRIAPVADGATILVHPAGGEVGSALLQLGALRELRMFGTASASKAHRLNQLGAELIDYRTQDYAQHIRVAAPKGIDAIYDGIGAGSWKKDLSLLQPGGRLVVYGLTDGLKNGRRNLPGLLGSLIRVPRTSYLTYFRQSVGVNGYRVDAAVAAHPAWYREDISALLQLLQEGRISPTVHQTFPLEQAAQAHQELGSGRAVGKIVLTSHGD